VVSFEDLVSGQLDSTLNDMSLLDDSRTSIVSEILDSKRQSILN